MKTISGHFRELNYFISGDLQGDSVGVFKGTRSFMELQGREEVFREILWGVSAKLQKDFRGISNRFQRYFYTFQCVSEVFRAILRVS